METVTTRGEGPTLVTTAAVDPAASLKTRMQATWASGNFAVIGSTLQIVGEQLCEAVDLRAGERVLDVAAGNGNATLAAARRFAEVTSTDFVPALLEGGRRRADAEGFDITFEVADAEALPYASESFDAVLSTFGVMFAPNHEQTARELRRVCRPGGRIAMANWTPKGFIGDLFRVVGRHVPPAPGARSPLQWGADESVRSLFPGVAKVAHTARHFAFRYRSPEHFIDVFRTYYGPVHKAFAALDASGQTALAADMDALLRRLNVGGSASLVVPGEYLETVITV
jgi:ubiquinone/menaquinone biosynthesis C-methylase UbiE